MDDIWTIAAELARDVGIARTLEEKERNLFRCYRRDTLDEANQLAKYAYESIEAIRSGDIERMKAARIQNQKCVPGC